MKNGFDFDGTLKELFEQDHPRLIDLLTGGIAVREFLNVELPRVQRRRVDLVMRLASGKIFHIEFQSQNEARVGYRMGSYCILLGETYRCQVQQVLLYVGQAKLRMVDRLDLGETTIRYRVVDIRDIDSGTLMDSVNPSDLALAILAGGGDRRIREIVGKLGKMRGTERDKALAQLVLLAGLRGASRRVELEMRNMGVIIDIRKNPVLMRWQSEAVEEGKAEGRAQGKAEGMAEGMEQILHAQLQRKFGKLPRWVADRLKRATVAQLQAWSSQILDAESIEDAIGKR